ncbi:unnamed protein product [Arctogadus glacialis]
MVPLVLMAPSLVLVLMGSLLCPLFLMGSSLSMLCPAVVPLVSSACPHGRLSRRIMGSVSCLSCGRHLLATSCLASYHHHGAFYLPHNAQRRRTHAP